MKSSLSAGLRRRIERHVDNLLAELHLPPEALAEARVDFVEHVVAATLAQQQEGTHPEEAVEQALRRFGNADEIRRQLAAWSMTPAVLPPNVAPRRPALVVRWLESRLQDLRFAVRSIRREPGFTATVVLTIAIGILATTTIFSVVDGILLRPLPYPDADRIVAIWPTFWFNNSTFEVLERDLLGTDATVFSAVGAYSPRSARLRDANGERMIRGPQVTARFLDVLGPKMTIGRTFEANANQPGNEKVVVVSRGFWERELGADPSAVGRTITLNGAPFTVTGVLSADYDLLQPDAELVFPKVFNPGTTGYQSQEMKGLGRLKPGATIEQARAEIDALLAGWKEEYGLDDGFSEGLTIVPFREYVLGDIRPTLLLLFGSVGLILLIASANVVNLLLARGIERQREVSVRLALGAGPARVVGQLITESSLLGLLGGALGFAGAVFAVRTVVTLLPDDTPRLAAVEIDGRVAGFAFALALVTGWLVSVVPAVRLIAAQLRHGLAASGRTVTARYHVRRLLVAVEICLAVVLLVGAGLLIKSAWQLSRVDPGLEPEGLVTFYLAPESDRIQSHDESLVFQRLITERLAALPGVRGVSAISQAPYNLDGGVVGCRHFDETNPDADSQATCRWRTVGDDYFAVAGTALLRGRSFGPDDAPGSEPVAVISQATANALFPGQDALGQRITTSFESVIEDGPVWTTVVGIVEDVRFLGLAEESPNLVYRHENQVGPIMEKFQWGGLEYMVRGEPGAAPLETVMETARAVDPLVVVSGYKTIGQLISASISERRAVLVLMSAFTAAALILATIGVFGVTAHAVRSRSRELSIRVALGATGHDVITYVLAGGLRVAVLGALAGLGLSLVAVRFLESFLYEVETTDPWVVAAAMALALMVSLIATWLPARRAAAADPVRALSAE